MYFQLVIWPPVNFYPNNYSSPVLFYTSICWIHASSWQNKWFRMKPAHNCVCPTNYTRVGLSEYAKSMLPGLVYLLLWDISFSTVSLATKAWAFLRNVTSVIKLFKATVLLPTACDGCMLKLVNWMEWKLECGKVALHYGIYKNNRAEAIETINWCVCFGCKQ